MRKCLLFWILGIKAKKEKNKKTLGRAAAGRPAKQVWRYAHYTDILD